MQQIEVIGGPILTHNFLVRAKLKQRIKVIKHKMGCKVETYNVDLLKDNRIKRKYHEALTK